MFFRLGIGGMAERNGRKILSEKGLSGGNAGLGRVFYLHATIFIVTVGLMY